MDFVSFVHAEYSAPRTLPGTQNALDADRQTEKDKAIIEGFLEEVGL